jgi:TPR repeat protein
VWTRHLGMLVLVLLAASSTAPGNTARGQTLSDTPETAEPLVRSKEALSRANAVCDESTNLLQKAVALGSSQAMVELGARYQNGWCVAADYPMAMHWYKLAAAKGSAKAMLQVSFLYGMGLVQGAPGEALRWEIQAADHGSRMAMISVARAYAGGVQGAAKDCDTARYWLEKASSGGDAEARSYLHNGFGGTCQW